MMKLHDYQQKSIETLAAFLEQTAKDGVKTAFAVAAERPYQSVKGLPEEMPYICLRVPTGGGKTFMATHALATAAKVFCHNDETPVCLWLAPSDAIVRQTAKALDSREHPYRRVLDAAFADVNVMSAADALQGHFDVQSAANIIVCTMQTLRKKEINKRKIYDDNGNLMRYFDNLSPEERDGLLNEDGTFNLSLANVLAMCHPIVIVDEAHNARTDISYESLARFDPSCILEFTATPQTTAREKKNPPSNVLCQVSARELRKAQMIKLPIYLESYPDWRETISRAVDKRGELEKAAKADGRGIRPITLYQAENKKGAANVETVKEALINQFKISPEQIAVATGAEKGIKGVNLLAQDCPIRHIITVQAIAEGWDCSFAYVLCALANISSPKAVEQVLGRVLRMPFAKESRQDELNRAYAFAVSNNFVIAANHLKEALINGAGFQELEADDFVYGGEYTPPLFGGGDNNNPFPPEQREIKIPMLAAKDQGAWRFVEDDDFLDAQWNIAKEDATLPGFALPEGGAGKGFIDVTGGGKVKAEITSFANKARQKPHFAEVSFAPTKTGLVAWLDANIPHPDIAQPQSHAFCLKVINAVLEARGDEYLQDLTRHRFYLRRAIEKRIDEHRRKARQKGVAVALKGVLPDGSKVGASPEVTVVMNERNYAPKDVEDMYLSKHLFSRIGKLDSGEERECAAYLASMEEVKCWVRNLDSKPASSFWLPTAEGRFYPDFIAKLKDGRWLVVEYKGAHLWDGAKHKREIGELWEGDRKHRVFVMIKNREWQAIKTACQKSKT